MKLKIHRSESQTLSAICDYLRLKKHFFWRQGNHAVWDAKRNAYRVNKNTIRGVPDIFLMRNNGLGSVLYGIEVKSDSGYQSEHQKSFQAQFCANGGVYILARSVDDIIKSGF